VALEYFVATMKATNQERYFFNCLLVAWAAFLVGLAVVHYRQHEPIVSRVSWPSPTEIQR
jgi:hypothetical protein